MVASSATGSMRPWEICSSSVTRALAVETLEDLAKSAAAGTLDGLAAAAQAAQGRGYVDGDHLCLSISKRGSGAPLPLCVLGQGWAVSLPATGYPFIFVAALWTARTILS